MHISTLLLPALAGQALAGCIYARSGESAPRNAQDFHDEVARALPAQHGGDDPPVVRELIGDLKNGITTPVGQQIANIILANSSVKTVTGQSAVKGTAPTTPAACAADKCCVWYNVAKDLTTLYGGCSDTARAAIRLGFHDAGEWDRTSTFGGADGSMILFKEYTRAENQGLQQISQQLNTTYNKYHTSNGISMADLVQFAAVHAIRTCPQAPRLRAYVGRKDGTVTNTNGLLPAVTASAASLVSLFQAKTIVAEDLVALVGAHTTSKQFFVDTTKAGQPQDTDPAVWDVTFYNQTLAPTAPAGVFRFQSDLVLSTYSATAEAWLEMTHQDDWNELFSRSYLRLSLLGVNNINGLTECTQALP